MKEWRTLYFTQAELEVMLELSGGSGHTLLRVGSPPDDGDITEAFVSLYRRGFLSRTERTFLPSDEAAFFREMCAAPLAVALRAYAPRDRTALCYAGGDTVWVCEHVRTAVAQQIRLSRIPYARLEEWLYETEILEPPLLTAQDAEELALLQSGEANPDSIRLRLETYRNGGESLGVCELLDGDGFPLIRLREGPLESAEPYTVEVLRATLARRFRKDAR